ncbi:MAG TPA: cytochrome P450 [Steroidobacteraceae bacterium]|nr:cytochrome P450 [Steroidobacteraceae bacterium]
MIEPEAARLKSPPEAESAPNPPNPHGQETKDRYGRDMFNDFDIDDPRFGDNLFGVLDDMLAKCPVARSHVGQGYWMVSRNADVRRIGQDWRTFSSAQGYQPNRPAGLPYLYPEESDPPRHTAWREVLNPHMSPKAVAAYEAQIRADANTLIDRFIDRGECEFISEFGSKLPGWAFFKNVLGVPVDDLDMLVQGVENGTFAPREERAKHFAKVFEYLGNYLAKRRDEPPRGDMVDTIAAGVEYETGVRCPWEDRVSVLVDLTFGGIATTTYVMAASLHYLATNSSARETLLSRPELMEGAVEEFARVFPPVVALGRTCTRDVEVAGTQMKKGDFVLLNYAASSRDPRVVDEPTKIDITRQTVLHSAFGVGIHRCIGSNLARIELKATFEEWLKRIPKFSVRPGTAPTYETGILRVMKQLHLIW